MDDLRILYSFAVRVTRRDVFFQKLQIPIYQTLCAHGYGWQHQVHRTVRMKSRIAKLVLQRYLGDAAAKSEMNAKEEMPQHIPPSTEITWRVI